MIIKNSTNKHALLEAFLSSPIGVGETVYMIGKPQTGIKVVEVLTGQGIFKGIDAEGGGYHTPTPREFEITNIFKRLGSQKIGANPFLKSKTTVRFVAFQLASILFQLGLGDDGKADKSFTKNGTLMRNLNWNPSIINKDGDKEYFQRDFVWSVRDKQLLLDSIYNGIDCGKILVRKHSWETLQQLSMEGETELAFNDIVDGKQRLNAIHGFINGEFPDSYGNYYADLSDFAQRKLTDHQLFAYAEMDDSTTDEEVLEQFLKLNFSGVPQSEEHINFVVSILNRTK